MKISEDFINMSIGERIEYIRKELKLSRAAFGNSIGVSGDTINNLERGRAEVKEHFLKLICKTYHVNYFFLSEGKGDSFLEAPDILMSDIIEEYGLDDLDRIIIEEYIKLDKETRNALKAYFKVVFKMIEQD